MKATLFSSSISGNSGEAIHKYSVKQRRRDQLATTRSIHTSRGETLHQQHGGELYIVVDSGEKIHV